MTIKELLGDIDFEIFIKADLLKAVSDLNSIRGIIKFFPVEVKLFNSTFVLDDECEIDEIIMYIEGL